MTHEIERKFLLKEPLNAVLKRYPRGKHIVIEQRYLDSTGSWTTRIRQTITDGHVEHWITLKRKVTDVSSIELETRVDAEFYAKMATQCGPALRKVRHEVEHEGHVWEIDLFLDPIFDSLVIAEIELDHEAEAFVRPEWVGEEVTHDKQYKNVRMVKRLACKDTLTKVGNADTIMT